MKHLQSYKLILTVFLLVISFAFSVPSNAGVMMMCGNGMVTGDEECDDNNMIDGDGCSANCTREPGAVCDNGVDGLGPSICDFGCDVTVVKSAEPAFNTEFDFLRVTFPLFRPKIVDQFTLSDSANPDITFEIPFLSLTFLTEFNLPPGWELDSISCNRPEISGDGQFMEDEFPEEFIDIGIGSGQTGRFAVLKCLFSGEYTCTAVNVPIEGQECNLEVTEVLASGSFDNEFPFNLTAGDPENPPLDDNFDLMRNESETVPGLPLSSLYTLVQNTPEDFNLDSIQCEGDADFDFILLDEGGVQLTCNSPGNVNCTFVNSPIVIRNIPTMSEWGLIATAVVMGMAGILFYRRRTLRA